MNIYISNLEVALIHWGNPKAMEKRLPAEENWLLHRLDHALLVLGAYVLFIFFGYICSYCGKDDGISTKGKKPKLTVKQKILKEPCVFPAMAIYNAVQVGLCAYMVVQAAKGKADRGFGIVCNSHELELDDASRGIASVLHVFYLTKVLDFLDTVFMVVRGKWKQVTFLHVYHHTSIFLIYWLILNAGYDGDIYGTVVLNGSIHFIMYFYYLLTTFNVTVPKAVKMMITNMQLIQFVCMMTQAAVLLFMGCPYPVNITKLCLLYIMSMFLLFLNFKRKAYAEKKKQN